MRTLVNLVLENEELRRERDAARAERDRLREMVRALERALAEMMLEEGDGRVWN